MPTYEYACPKCHHAFEIFQSMKDEPLKQCPACKKSALKRLVGGGAGLIFKGTGFYITDYKKTAAPKAGAAAGEKSAGAGGSGTPPAKSSETKSTAATAAK